jgi:hypothetical protein
MLNTTMAASVVAELLPLPADARHPSWCHFCYRCPESGYPVHAFEPPTEVVNDVSVSFTMMRSDSAEGPGQTVAYTHTISELEGEQITMRLVDDSRRVGAVR